MPREQKVGFTILILIIGFAGAFCFRREPEAQVAFPALEDQTELNRLISEYHMRPILPGIDTNDQPESQRIEDRLLAQLRSDSERSPSDQTVPAPIPSYTSGVPKSQKHPAVLVPDLSRKTKPVHPVSTNRNQQTIMHTVVPGDTLSGIAFQYLGSASRFNEIYEANRSSLSGPDRLKLGMKLLIPNGKRVLDHNEPIKEAKKEKELQKTSETSTSKKKKEARLSQNGEKTKTPTVSGKNGLANSTSSPEHTRKKKLFVPMKHSPFSRTASGRQATRQ